MPYAAVEILSERSVAGQLLSSVRIGRVHVRQLAQVVEGGQRRLEGRGVSEVVERRQLRAGSVHFLAAIVSWRRRMAFGAHRKARKEEQIRMKVCLSTPLSLSSDLGVWCVTGVRTRAIVTMPLPLVDSVTEGRRCQYREARTEP